jgi:hypothetical protein
MVKLPAAARRLLPGKLGTVAPAGRQGALDPFSPATLARVIRRLRPDLVHSMEFQHASYRVLRAKDAFGPGFPPWLATNWGSDLYFYRHLPDHRAMIERLLGAIDFYSCECRRDVDIARELGLAAPALPVFPNTGGFDLQEIGRCNSGPPSRRRLLMVKGYQHFAGRAMTALDAVERCRDLLAGYELVVFSASYDVRDRVDAMARDGWNIRAPGYCRHDEMLALFGRARCYLGVNISDAISTSLLESMAMGAFPIQTNTSCCDEWIVDGESGFSIPPDDLETIVARLRRALTDDALVDAAAERNAVTVRERLDARILAAKAAAMYEGVFAAIGGQSGALAAG